MKRPGYEGSLRVPFVERVRWLGNILRLDFGYSWTYKVPVAELIAQRAPATILLSLCSLSFYRSYASYLTTDRSAPRPGHGGASDRA